METFTLSRKELHRPGLLKALCGGRLTNAQVAAALRITVRQVRRLKRRFEAGGPGVLVRNDAHWSVEEQLAGTQAPTHLGRILQSLAIGYIAAHSPQAKGRVERLWGTLQDRLVSELRLRDIRTVEAAQAYLPEFIAD